MRLNTKDGWTRKKLAAILDCAIKNKIIKLSSFDGCRNKRPSRGWTYGQPDISWCGRTLGVIPCQNYWSGSAPTPSTQYPVEVVNFATKIGALI